MADFQASKALVRRFYEEFDAAAADGVGEVLERFTTKGYRFRGLHPFHEQRGAAAAARVFWTPFRRAIGPIQRRQDVFMAGVNEIDGTEWVCSMGHLMGLFDREWLGIPPSRKMTFLRYAEFHRVAEGRIGETAFFFDLIGVMRQAGLRPLPPSTGAELLTPGPLTHDGLLFDPQDPAESALTLDLVNRMRKDLVSSGLQSPGPELGRTWHDGMIWFGPSGIGAAYTIGRYQEQHQGPFRAGLEDIAFQGHVCRFAEGKYAGWFGWPNLTMKARGGFLGMPGCERTVEMRVVDVYRREGGKLAENWIFIDLPYFLKQQGLDVLERTTRIGR